MNILFILSGIYLILGIYLHANAKRILDKASDELEKGRTVLYEAKEKIEEAKAIRDSLNPHQKNK